MHYKSNPKQPPNHPPKKTKATLSKPFKTLESETSRKQTLNQN